MQPKIYDIAGIGIGPFNLGLAALLSELPALSFVFFDQKEGFEWHPGMMIDHATVQVPFYADLVTLASPASRYNFMSFLQHQKRLFRFGTRENDFITRKEYNQYCSWVAARVTGLYFGTHVTAILYNNKAACYEIITIGKNGLPKNFFSHHLVIGIGSEPYIPPFLHSGELPDVFHASAYLFKKPMLLGKKKIVIIGSGQSAAEIMYDLLPYYKQFSGGLDWFTRSSRIYPLDFSKFSLEMTSPDYIDYFYGLDPAVKMEVLKEQNSLYKGINASLISNIYNFLYETSLDDPHSTIRIHTNAELKAITQSPNLGLDLRFSHRQQGSSFNHMADAVILATGYRQAVPPFLQPVRERIRWKDGLYDVCRNYSIDKNESEIFVQNAEMHTHGFSTPDLGMGPYRNAIIINAILGKEHFILEKNTAFQRFGF